MIKQLSITAALLGALVVTSNGALAATSPAAPSLSAPVPGSLDSKIVTFAYTPDVVFKLPVTVGMHTHILLAPDEELVELPRVGDKIRWRIEGNERNLYIKATVPGTNTSLSLVTDKRVYQFELRSTESAGDRIQKVAFSYPDQEASILATAQRNRDADRASAESAMSRLKAQNLASDAIDPSQLRFMKVTTTNAEYTHMHAYTDGVKTWMRMPAGIQDLPAVFMVLKNESDKESLMPVNYTVVDRKSIRDRDVIVIDRTAPVWMLQIGQDVQVRVTND